MITPPTMLQFAKAEVLSMETNIAWQKKLISAVEKNEAAQKKAVKKAAESQVMADKAVERAKNHTKSRIAAQAEATMLAEEGGALRDELVKLFHDSPLQYGMCLLPTDSSDKPRKIVSIVEPEKAVIPDSILEKVQVLWLDDGDSDDGDNEPTDDELQDIHMNYTGDM